MNKANIEADLMFLQTAVRALARQTPDKDALKRDLGELIESLFVAQINAPVSDEHIDRVRHLHRALLAAIDWNL